MDIFSKFIHKENLSIALGFFDGVHVAHQKIIQNTVDFARKNGLKSAVISFESSPANYFSNANQKTIQTLENRIKYIEDLGVDYLYLLDFSKIVEYSAEEYLSILIENFSPKAITTGFNHTFGKNKNGSVDLLKYFSEKYGFSYFEISPQMVEGDIVSSTLIKTLINTGNIQKANEMLGKRFLVDGKVVEGNKIGRTIGFKTANLCYPNDIVDLENGVYGCEIIFDDKIYKGVANLGIKPTISDKNIKSLEVNIFDFDKDIYGENITVEFIEKIRNEIKFNSLKDLTIQIQKDVEYWRTK